MPEALQIEDPRRTSSSESQPSPWPLGGILVAVIAGFVLQTCSQLYSASHSLSSNDALDDIAKATSSLSQQFDKVKEIAEATTSLANRLSKIDDIASSTKSLTQQFQDAVHKLAGPRRRPERPACGFLQFPGYEGNDISATTMNENKMDSLTVWIDKKDDQALYLEFPMGVVGGATGRDQEPVQYGISALQLKGAV